MGSPGEATQLTVIANLSDSGLQGHRKLTFRLEFEPRGQVNLTKSVAAGSSACRRMAEVQDPQIRRSRTLPPTSPPIVTSLTHYAEVSTLQAPLPARSSWSTAPGRAARMGDLP